jgi:Na+-transporting methylmalonyl-CoA/oxaloacetate decarboxylase gamma subunit
VGFVMATLIVLAIFIGSVSSISTQSCQIGSLISKTN